MSYTIVFCVCIYSMEQIPFPVMRLHLLVAACLAAQVQAFLPASPAVVSSRAVRNQPAGLVASTAAFTRSR